MRNLERHCAKSISALLRRCKGCKAVASWGCLSLILLAPACDNSAAKQPRSLKPDVYLQVQVALARYAQEPPLPSQPDFGGHPHRIAAEAFLPIRIAEQEGHALARSDGFTVAGRWSSARWASSEQKKLVLEDFRWSIRNRLITSPDTRTYTEPNGSLDPPYMEFSRTYQPLVSIVRARGGVSDSPYLVLRARVVPGSQIDAPDIELRDPGSAKKS